MQNTHIEWADHTFNPWEGCTQVSPGCANCYALTRNKRFAGGKNWGPGAPRRRTTSANWKQPLKWNRDVWAECPKCGVKQPHGDVCIVPGCVTLGSEMQRLRPRVFCASLADWLDDEVPIEWLADLLNLIHDTPNLDWLMLTKRPENWAHRLMKSSVVFDSTMVRRWRAGAAPINIWIGTTVENQDMADLRIPQLLNIPAKVRFLSCEPLIGEVNLDVVGQPGEKAPDGTVFDHLHWVICGGESGPGARSMHPDWARSLRDQCVAANVPFHFKQWGEWAPYEPQAGGDLGGLMRKGRVRHLQFDREPDGHFRKGDCYVERVGTAASGRRLDGREWNEFPQPEVLT